MSHSLRLLQVARLSNTKMNRQVKKVSIIRSDIVYNKFLTKEQLELYYARTLEKEWVGSWSMAEGLEDLCKTMLDPDVKQRSYTEESLKHPFFTSLCHDANKTCEELQVAMSDTTAPCLDDIVSLDPPSFDCSAKPEIKQSKDSSTIEDTPPLKRGLPHRRNQVLIAAEDSDGSDVNLQTLNISTQNNLQDVPEAPLLRMASEVSQLHLSSINTTCKCQNSPEQASVLPILCRENFTQRISTTSRLQEKEKGCYLRCATKLLKGQSYSQQKKTRFFVGYILCTGNKLK